MYRWNISLYRKSRLKHISLFLSLSFTFPLLSLALSPPLVCPAFARSCTIYEANRFTLFASLGFTKNVDFCDMYRWEPNLHHYPDELAALEILFPRRPWIVSYYFIFRFPLLTGDDAFWRVLKTNVLGGSVTLLDNVKFSFDTHEPLAHRQNEQACTYVCLTIKNSVTTEERLHGRGQIRQCLGSFLIRGTGRRRKYFYYRTHVACTSVD